MNQSFALTRSKSDTRVIKSIVYSPTPIKELNVDFLESLNSSPNSKESSFASTEHPLAIRKFQSAGLIGMNQNL